LVTSRFPLVDLDGYAGAGHRAIVLDDLERPVALDVLRAWRVKGDDAALLRLLEPMNIGGFYHALSVAVLGSYLGNFADGDPAQTPEFSLADAEESDPKARRLHRILEHYAKALSSAERDLLARLSLFPRGVQFELLGWIVQSGGEVAGALVGLSDRELVRYLERLKGLGLVFRYETDRRAVYSAHPFLRDFFRNLLTAKPESVHESVRIRLAPSLEVRPKTNPTDPTILNQYELLIEQTLLAGRVQEAFDLYWLGLGGYRNIGVVLGEYGRGLRLLERFVPWDDFSHIESQLSRRLQSALVNDLGVFAEDLGDLCRARRAYAHCQQLDAGASDQSNESTDVHNLAALELHAGHFRQALKYSEAAVSLDTEDGDEAHTAVSLTYRAALQFALGDITVATAAFQRATELVGNTLWDVPGIYDAECKILRGDRSGARSQTQANRESAIRNNHNPDLCRSNALLARILIPDDPAQASRCLHDAAEFANRSGAVELQLRCFHAACELHLHLGNYPQSIAEAEAGILLADTCGFGWWSIDLRIVLAETFLAAGDPRKTLQSARNALDRSEHPDCQYAWGKADGLHFCGLAHLQLGERELGIQRLTAALELRERLGHGRVEETRRALAACRP
jgi:tetratricopeptide (TPR) repeat protein